MLAERAWLTNLQTLISTLDQRYWERQSDISRDKRAAAPQESADPRSENRSNNQQSNSSKTNNSMQQSKGKDQKKPEAPAAASSSNKLTAKANTIADVLGPDGKLKPEERQRRMDNKLCLRCCEPGHMANDCPRSASKPKPKGRAAVATTAAAAPTTTSASGKA
jgi:hypothetical protein